MTVGQLFAFMGLTAPTGTVFLEGQEVSRTGDYTDLWELSHIDDSGSKTNGSQVITGLSDTSKMVAGLNVEGAGVAANSIIQSVDSSTQITLSQNLTATETSAILVSPYGLGDGSTTWDLPDLRGTVIGGAGDSPSLSNRALGTTTGTEKHTLSVGELPAHNHSLRGSTLDGNEPEIEVDAVLATADAGGNSSIYRVTPANTDFRSDSISDTGSGNPHENMQPTIFLNYCIVYSVTTANDQGQTLDQQTSATSVSDSDQLYLLQGGADKAVTASLLKSDRLNITDLTTTVDLQANPTAVDVGGRSEYKYKCSVTGSHTQAFSNVSNLGAFIGKITNTANAPVMTFSGVTLSPIGDLPTDFSFAGNALTFPNDSAGSTTYIIIGSLVDSVFEFRIAES